MRCSWWNEVRTRVAQGAPGIARAAADTIFAKPMDAGACGEVGRSEASPCMATRSGEMYCVLGAQQFVRLVLKACLAYLVATTLRVVLDPCFDHGSSMNFGQSPDSACTEGRISLLSLSNRFFRCLAAIPTSLISARRTWFQS